MSEPVGVHIFSNGFEYRAWDERNCRRCVLEPTCDLVYGPGGVGEAFLGDGLFSQEVADRLGYTDACSSVLGWACKERQADAEPPAPAAREMGKAGAAMRPGFDAQDGAQ